ncbi:hypothetical protein TNCV_2922591 [Trichonephila clavipes]|nr:hypothetical protein TNCV_2922591 [Trichonephila clavipes]
MFLPIVEFLFSYFHLIKCGNTAYSGTFTFCDFLVILVVVYEEYSSHNLLDHPNFTNVDKGDGCGKRRMEGYGTSIKYEVSKEKAISWKYYIFPFINSQEETTDFDTCHSMVFSAGRRRMTLLCA